ncbi:hypothetical protein [uncultured Aquimarina sp.]|uniref:hypothetical protein n=1 Tax=uncultured Aquimarina sp. TaxID=575652 RepID=UPI0026141B45|nr:hypothetical protein [uncultured Aquimarina sp.]
MKKLFVIITLGFTILSCNKNQKDDFPSVIKNQKTIEFKRLKRVKGTRIFAKIPENYVFSTKSQRYQKTDSLSIQFTEFGLGSINFYKAKPSFKRSAFESKGLKIDVLKDVRFNDLDAIFGDGPSSSKKVNERETFFIFGDDEFLVMVKGVYQKRDTIGRKEILEIFKNLNHQKDLKFPVLD